MKKLTIILLLIAGSSWIYFFLRLSSSNHSSENNTPKNEIRKEEILSTILQKPALPEFTLARDPFTKVRVVEKSAPKITKPSAPEVLSNIKLSMVLNGNQKTALLSHKGSQSFSKINDIAWGYKIISISNNSVLAERNGRQYIISK